MIEKFFKKPVVIEAIQFTEEVALKYFRDREYIFDKLTASGRYRLTPEEKIYEAYVDIDTPEGKMRANIGDWIIKGVNGEFYPCKPHIFAKTYSLVADAEPEMMLEMSNKDFKIHKG